ncbi:hypothetical protein VNO77_34013 [Canavalia gladiata]|uniref:Uncharacterized protein n=1 Tax=Canavalia gladiata TaxID=3824 RepID=A0AAN9KDJ0_CANGL
MDVPTSTLQLESIFTFFLFLSSREAKDAETRNCLVAAYGSTTVGVVLHELLEETEREKRRILILYKIASPGIQCSRSLLEEPPKRTRCREFFLKVRNP